MASAASSSRLCLRAYRQAPAPQRLASRVFVARRTIVSTPVRWRGSNKQTGEDTADPTQSAEFDSMVDPDLSRRQKKLQNPVFNKMVRENIDDYEQMTTRGESIVDKVAGQFRKAKKETFWGDEEEDPDYMTEAADEEDFSEDDIMSMAHGKLEEHREYREYARIAAWQMPLLSKLARPFEPPTAQQCLRFRYTTYMGESHPAENKVVVEFSPQDLPLTEAQQLKLKKLLGPRWNPETNVAKMSCEQFDHQAQNKRYLADLVDKLVAQARDPTDMFEDVPLDTRHHKTIVKPKFPKEWRLTEERIKEIEDTRQKALLLDQAKTEAGTLIDGKERIAEAFATPVPVPELLAARNRSSPSKSSSRMRI